MKPFSNLQEDLRKWFSKTDPSGDWKRINSKGEAIGPCAREPGEPKPKCMSAEKRASLTKKERASAVRAKRKHDPNPERKGEPINVSNFGKGKISENMENLNEKNEPTNPELWSRAKSLARSKFDVYPSAYANGWASKWYKGKGGGWKTVSEDSEVKSNLKTFKQISELVKPDVKNDLNSLDKISFVKKHGLTKSVARQKLTTEAKDEQEYGYEGDMALNQLATLIRCGEMIRDMLKPDTDLPEWVQSKITLSTDYIQTAADYLYSEMKESKDVGDVPSGDVNSPNVSLRKGKTVITNTVTEASSAAVRMAKALQRAKEQREREERAGAALLNPKPKTEEVVQEGRPSQRHPLEGHEYHKKSNDALVHIAKDAHAAAEAMKSHNTTAENKYRDQANDSATVRHYRQKNGMPDWYKKKYGHVKEGVVNEVMDEPNYKNSIQARQKKADDANKPPFDGPYTTGPSTVTDKSGAKHGPMSRVRDLARAAAKRQAQKMPVKEGLEESRKAEIVKEIMKKGKKKEDNSFQAEPVIGSTVVKADN